MDGTFNWSLLCTIGKGGSSTVYKAEVKPIKTSPDANLPQYVAVKQINTDTLNKAQVEGIQAETRMMKDLGHRNIVHSFFAQEESNRINIVMEYATYGSIRQFYQREGCLDEGEVVYCVQQIVEGLAYLHGNGFAHRDIKCANCLLFPAGRVKLADFGASKRYESVSIVSGLKGTPNWMAPEVIRGSCQGEGWMKADIWSLGCSLVEMLTAKMPYAEYENPMTAMYRIASGEAPRPHRALSPPVQELILLCCGMDPDQRPDAFQLEVFLRVRFELDALPVPARLFEREVSPLGEGQTKKGEGDGEGAGQSNSQQSFPSIHTLDSLGLQEIGVEEVPEDLEGGAGAEGAPTPSLFPRFIPSLSHSTVNLAPSSMSREGTALAYPLNGTGGLEGVEAEGGWRGAGEMERERREGEGEGSDDEYYEDFYEPDEDLQHHECPFLATERVEASAVLVPLPSARPQAPLSGDQLKAIQKQHHQASEIEEGKKAAVTRSMPSIWGVGKGGKGLKPPPPLLKKREGREKKTNSTVSREESLKNSGLLVKEQHAKKALHNQSFHIKGGEGRGAPGRQGKRADPAKPLSQAKQSLRSYSAGVYSSVKKESRLVGQAKPRTDLVKLPLLANSHGPNHTPSAQQRYVQSAPAMSRSVNLPPLQEQK